MSPFCTTSLGGTYGLEVSLVLNPRMVGTGFSGSLGLMGSSGSCGSSGFLTAENMI